MISPRLKCENPCKATGHTFVNGRPERCRCLQLEVNQRRLGAMYTPNAKSITKLSAVQDRDNVFQGTLESIRQHVACVLLERAARNESWITIDAYRLIEIFLDQDTEHKTLGAVLDSDLLIMLLGFGDPRNRYLPELIVQALSRREVTMKPTWVILGTTVESLRVKYSDEVFERI